ncbi:MAG TPA: MBL fold metallo-hydrolase, partial [Dehalococcoidales bacterium]|nr:MBL fold metallo-hydrolase [Dehalococcoidales bacterium]
MKLTDGLFAYVWQGNDNNCNSYVFANTLGAKHILIDPGHVVTPFYREAGFDKLIKNMEKDGLRPEDIGLTVITHAHPDHMEAGKKFREKYGAKVAVHVDEAAAFKMFEGGEIDILLKTGKLKIDNQVTENLEIIHTPGHSTGEISLYWPAKKALAVGDVVFFRSTGRVDLPGGNPGKLRASIEELAKLDVEYLLCGHPYQHPGVIIGKEKIKENYK